MESTGTALPELDGIRGDPIAAPEGRERNFRAFGPPGLELCRAFLEGGTIGNRRGLVL